MELRRSLRVQFPGGVGKTLSGIIDHPAAEPVGWALFAHCFTCTKDLKAIVRISRKLAESGVAVLRFDFTGLGESHGDFTETDFESNRSDIIAAYEFLDREHSAPGLLIGHSLGGAASLSIANHLDAVQGVVTLAAPSDTHHLSELLLRMDPKIGTEGIGQVTIGGRTYRIRREMVECLRDFDLTSRISRLGKSVLIFHSPSDETVGYEHAIRIFSLVNQPLPDDSIPFPKQIIQPRTASLITLPGSDHLIVNQSADLPWIADTIFAWYQRISQA